MRWRFHTEHKPSGRIGGGPARALGALGPLALLILSPVPVAAQTAPPAEKPGACGYDVVPQIAFERGQSRFLPPFDPMIADFVRQAAKCRWAVIEVVATVGADEAPEAARGDLGLARARIVRDALGKAGLRPSPRLETYVNPAGSPGWLQNSTFICSYACYGPNGWIRPNPQQEILLSPAK